MNTLLPDQEINILKKIAGTFARHPLQKNQLLESDAEIIDFKNKSFRYLVLKMDGIQEEIKEKLYEDPNLIGWMAATVTMSDLAATGAIPLGILLNLQIPKDQNENWLKEFQAGINEACERYQVNILGGDTNFDSCVSVATTGVGTIESGEPISRKGLKADDLLYTTGTLGSGNAYAYAHYFDSELRINYRPVARLRECKTIREFATSCMDTSDGLFPALSVLSEINNAGFEITNDLQGLLHSDASRVSRFSRIPAWMLLAGPHGEYELLFTVPADKRNEFEERYRNENAEPVCLGKVTLNRKLHFTSESMEVTCDPAAIANLFHESNGNVPAYYDLLKQQQARWLAL